MLTPVLLAAVVAAATPPRDPVRDRLEAASTEDAQLGGYPPFAHMLRVDGFDRQWSRIDFSTRFVDNHPARRRALIVARRVSGDRVRPPRTDYAEAASCPGLQDVVLQVETVPAPHIDVPGLGRYEGPITSVTLDGPSYRVWGRGSITAAAVDDGSVEIRVGGDHPAAAWAERVLAVAAPCWRPQEPA